MAKLDVHRMLHGLLLAWIAGSALFFFLRFSMTFYVANASAINALVPW